MFVVYSLSISPSLIILSFAFSNSSGERLRRTPPSSILAMQRSSGVGGDEILPIVLSVVVRVGVDIVFGLGGCVILA